MKRVLVTGGTRGIGLACVEKYVREGWEVYAFWHENEADAKRAEALFPAVRFIRADVSAEAEVSAAFSSVPPLDVLVNNAGVSLFAQVQDMTADDFKSVLNVNLVGTFLCSKYAVKRMLSSGGGAIVNVASIWGQSGGSCESAYSASKGGVIALTKALSKELAPSKITVNCVSPGFIDTRMNARFTKEEKEAFLREVPLERAGTPEEVASAVFFLSRAEYVTGAVLSVSGGLES